MTALATPPISCYVRTLNEERNIGRCVEAALRIAAEVIVIDSGSTDRTIQIAEAAGAKVFRQNWLGNGFQKRFGEDQCRSDWLLDLDADEVVTEQLAQEIENLFAEGEPTTRIFALRLVTISPTGFRFENFGYRWSNKLYDRRVVRAPAHKAWDQFEVPTGVLIGHLKAPVDHYAYRDFAHLAEKQNRVSTVRANETTPPSRLSIAIRVFFGLPFYFGKHYFQRGLLRAGTEGFAIAGILAYGRWLRDVKRYERLKTEHNADKNKASPVQRSAIS